MTGRRSCNHCVTQLVDALRSRRYALRKGVALCCDAEGDCCEQSQWASLQVLGHHRILRQLREAACARQAAASLNMRNVWSVCFERQELQSAGMRQDTHEKSIDLP